MRILVTGGDGQLGRALGRLAGEHDIVPLSRSDLDLTTPATIDGALARVKPDAVINAAAYTAVDAAEANEALAHAVNATGAGYLAAACAAAGVGMIHVSTDYVFDGTLDRPYREDDATAPISAYGRTKLAGEQAVLSAHPEALVVRTSWVYSEDGRNFLKTMLDLAKTRNALQVVSDQFGAPTYATDLARGLLSMVVSPRSSSSQRIFHLTASGRTSWFGFANAIFEAAKAYGSRVPTVSAVSAEAWPSPAARPKNSVLDCSRATETYHVVMPVWGDGLVRCLRTLSGVSLPNTEAK